MVEIGDKITSYIMFTENFVFLEEEKLMIVNDKKATFDYLNIMVKKWRNVNRIHKPFYIIFYSDWKNKKITKDSYDRKEVLTVDQDMKTLIDNMEIISN